MPPFFKNQSLLNFCNSFFSYTNSAPSVSSKLKMQFFNKELFLKNLGITEVPFTSVEGNTQGYAYTAVMQIAINPLRKDPLAVILHETAHCLLHRRSDDNE